jgi:hypothetical protein
MSEICSIRVLAHTPVLLVIHVVEMELFLLRGLDLVDLVRVNFIRGYTKDPVPQ